MLINSSQNPTETSENHAHATRRLNLRAEFVLWSALRRYCSAHGLTMSDAMRRALKLLLSDGFLA